MKKGINYLDSVPRKSESVVGFKSMDGRFYVKRENVGIYNKIAQVLFRRPRYTNIELEEYGMFIWQYIDGEHTIYEIADLVREKFGDRAEPLHKRICEYFSIMRDNGLVVLYKK